MSKSADGTQPGPSDPGSHEGRHIRLQSRDPDEMAACVRYAGADEVQQLGRGQFHGELQLLQLDTIRVLQLSVNRALRAEGVRPDAYGFGVVTAANKGLILQGRHVKPGQINVICPPGEWEHVSTAPEYNHLNVMVDADTLRGIATRVVGSELDRLLTGAPIQPDPALFSALEAFLKGLFALVSIHPELLCQPENRRSLELACAVKLVQTAFSGTQAAQEEGRHVANRRAMVRRAEEFMLAQLDKPLTNFEICEEIAVSEQSLRYAFREHYDMEPMAYFKARKLNAIRKEFKRLEADAVSAPAFATRWGFAHMDQFVKDYALMFGELPGTN